MGRTRKSSAELRMGPFPTTKTEDYIVVELKHDSTVAYAPSRFEALEAGRSRADSLNRVVERFGVRAIRSHLGMSRQQIRRLSTEAPPDLRRKIDADFAHSAFAQMKPRRTKDLAQLVTQLKRNPSVWSAYIAPRPVPPPAPEGTSRVSRNFEPCQGYLHSPPDGIGAMEAWRLRGGRGEGVTICDIEGNWNLRHEDLPRVRHIGGTLQPALSWRNHGTAVLGEMVSKPGRSGTVGISPGARAAVHSFVIAGRGNLAQAIRNSARRLNRGDVILIELQATGPNGKYVAMQYWNDVFSAIRAAVASGIVVVEAAGNGDEDFQHPVFRNTGLQKDSGAIVVGAGVPPTNCFGNFGADWGFQPYSKIGNPRSRMWFSNYGRIVNVQAWGWHVTTLGYGNAQGGSSQNRWYTHRFSGTSSASPIVTGAVACIQGRAKVRRRSPLTPLVLRSLLIRTGTPQTSDPTAPLRQHIGPQVNLSRAIRAV